MSFFALFVGVVGVVGCATDPNAGCIGNGCTEQPSGKQTGHYLSTFRQGIYNLATMPGGSCERACCELPGGAWDQRSEGCAYVRDALQLSACTNWCHKETAGSAASETDQLEAIEQNAEAQTGGPSGDGTIETRENMGTKFVMLDGMVAPVTVGQDPSLVQSLQLGFTRDPELSVIRVHISPKRARNTEWKYLRCHAVGLSVGDDWSTGGAKGSDGSWLRFETTHDGSVIEGGTVAVEIISFSVDPAMVREWALAEQAGGQICNDKFVLSAGQKARILEFLDTPG
jgi:hypothetical protein